MKICTINPRWSGEFWGRQHQHRHMVKWCGSMKDALENGEKCFKYRSEGQKRFPRSWEYSWINVYYYYYYYKIHALWFCWVGDIFYPMDCEINLFEFYYEPHSVSALKSLGLHTSSLGTAYSVTIIEMAADKIIDIKLTQTHYTYNDFWSGSIISLWTIAV